MQEIICRDSETDVIQYAKSSGFKLNDDDVIRGTYEGAVIVVRAMKPKEPIESTLPRSHNYDKEKTDEYINKSGSSIRIFISYAHEDEQWCKRFQRYLKPAEKPGQLEIWSDKSIEYGVNCITKYSKI